jgi:hypothetical protein
VDRLGARRRSAVRASGCLPWKAAPDDSRVSGSLGRPGFPGRARHERIAERASHQHSRKRDAMVAATPSVLDRIDLVLIRGHTFLDSPRARRVRPIESSATPIPYGYRTPWPRSASKAASARVARAPGGALTSPPFTGL